jgi:uncharacterized protein YjiS (DUF1127 family)
MSIHTKRTPFGHLARTLIRARPGRQGRRPLAALDRFDDHLLADIGLSRVAGGIDRRRMTEL